MEEDFRIIGRLWAFLAASIGLHLILVLAISVNDRSVPVRNAGLSVQARIVRPKQESAAPQMLGKETPYKQPTQQTPSGTEPMRHAKPVSAEARKSPPEGRTGTEQEIRMATGGNAGSVAAAAPPSLPQEGASIDAVREYLFLLLPEIRRLKHYPALARKRGWEGTVEITVRLSRVQSVPAAVVMRSSGFQSLDDQALEMIAQAVRLVAVPESLRGKDVTVSVPIRFSLED